MINLMSDTVTQPTPAMRQTMVEAVVGDDVFGSDPTVNALQDKAAQMFGMEAALFCPSGTMTNQIALAVHTDRLEQVICEEKSHIYQYETGGYAYNSGIAIKLIQGQDGKFTPTQLEQAIQPTFDWTAQDKLVVVENTCNKGGGSIYTLQELQALQAVCRKHQLRFHLDGARLFNALVETGDTPLAIGQCFDSISICLSKGLGAPVGSLLLGRRAFIDKARRLRKVMGGGMRQAGILAAAGIYALEHNITRLSEDNARARALGEAVAAQAYCKKCYPVQSNIVIFELTEAYTCARFLEALREEDIHGVAFGPQTIRFVTHLHIDDQAIDKVIKKLQIM